MAADLLAEDRVEDARRLLVELAGVGVRVEVAVCARAREFDYWSLYLATDAAGSPSIHRTVYGCLDKVPDSWVEPSNVTLIGPSDPVARDALAARARHPGRTPVRYRGSRLGRLDVDEAYIYPKNYGEMSPTELLQTLVALSNRPAGSAVRPVTITLTNGGPVRGVIAGFDLRLPGGLTVRVMDEASGKLREIPGDDIANIL